MENITKILSFYSYFVQICCMNMDNLQSITSREQLY